MWFSRAKLEFVFLLGKIKQIKTLCKCPEMEVLREISAEIYNPTVS